MCGSHYVLIQIARPLLSKKLNCWPSFCLRSCLGLCLCQNWRGGAKSEQLLLLTKLKSSKKKSLISVFVFILRLTRLLFSIPRIEFNIFEYWNFLTYSSGDVTLLPTLPNLRSWYKIRFTIFIAWRKTLSHFHIIRQKTDNDQL